MNTNPIIDKEQFKRFFFYGIENKREVKEGILCFASKETYKKQVLKNWYEIPNEQIESQIIEDAIPKYKQFYRFVTLNDSNNNYTMCVDEELLRKELEEEMQLLKQEQKVISTKAGIFFTREREQQLLGAKYYVVGKGVQGEYGWTKQIYDILEKLEKIEKHDDKKYYKYWILTKYERAINRFDIEEGIKVKNIYENFKKEKNCDNKDEIDFDFLEL